MSKEKKQRRVSKMTKELLKEFYKQDRTVDEETIKELEKFYKFHQKAVIEKNPSVKEFLELKRQDKTDKKLKFDFNSGELLIIGSDESDDKNSVVVDSIYKDGFFCNDIKIAA